MSDRKNKLEMWVVGQLMPIDPTARQSKASGASTENYDVQTSVPLAIECKIQGVNKNPVIHIDTWEKLVQEIPMRSDRIPVLFIQNATGQRFAIMDAENFFDDFVYKLYKE